MGFYIIYNKEARSLRSVQRSLPSINYSMFIAIGTLRKSIGSIQASRASRLTLVFGALQSWLG